MRIRCEVKNLILNAIQRIEVFLTKILHYNFLVIFHFQRLLKNLKNSSIGFFVTLPTHA